MVTKIKEPTLSHHHNDYSKCESDSEVFSKTGVCDNGDSILPDTEFKGLLKTSLSGEKNMFIDLAWFLSCSSNIIAE